LIGFETFTSVHVVDVELARSLADARKLGPPSTGGRPSSWASPSYGAYGGLIGVIEACCGVDPVTTNKFLVVDDEGRVHGELDPDPSFAQAIYDASGRHQLILVEEGQLFRRSGGGLSPVGTGFSTVTW
jgi:hypothetical protein